MTYYEHACAAGRVPELTIPEDPLWAEVCPKQGVVAFGNLKGGPDRWLCLDHAADLQQEARKCSVGRHVRSQLPGWDTPCPNRSSAVVLLPMMDDDVLRVCAEHLEQLREYFGEQLVRRRIVPDE